MHKLQKQVSHSESSDLRNREGSEGWIIPDFVTKHAVKRNSIQSSM